MESMTICGAQVLGDDTSGDGSVVDGNTNLYIDELNCMKDLKDKGAEMKIPITLTNVGSVDYDASTNANNTILEANSGSSSESIVDISFYSPLSSSDYVAQDLDA